MAKEVLIKKKTFKWIVMGIIMAIIALAFCFLIIGSSGLGDTSFEPFGLIVGLLFAIFCGYISYLLFKKVADKSPALFVDSKGIVENSSSISLGFIPWDRIDNVYVKRGSLGNYLCFEIIDLEGFLEERNVKGAKKKAILANKKMGYEGALVDLGFLKESDIEAIIDIFDNAR
ncbi:MAG: hypothetical protein MR314_01040 [Ezakiella sp.]|nr:hypothetical protein [Ezakiella sp.]